MSDPIYPPPPPPPPPGGPAYQPIPASAYANWGQRLGAYLVDVLILVPFYIVAGIGAGINSGSGNAFGVLLMVIGYIAAIAVAIWNLIFRQGRTGWSIGKRTLGIRLLSESTGQPLGPGMTFVRMLAHILDALPCYIGYLWPIWDAKRQTFADKIIGSVVIPQQETRA